MIHGLGLIVFVNNVIFVVVVDIIIVLVAISRQFKADICRLLALVLLFSLLSSCIFVFIHHAIIIHNATIFIVIIDNFIVVIHLIFNIFLELLSYFFVFFGGLSRFGRHRPRLALTARVSHGIRALRRFDNIDDLSTRLLNGGLVFLNSAGHKIVALLQSLYSLELILLVVRFS